MALNDRGWLVPILRDHHLHKALLRSSLGLNVRLRADLQRATTAGVAHEFLHDFHFLAVGDEQSREGVAKSMPANFFPDSGSQGRGLDDFLQNGVWPKRISPLRMRARKDPVISLAIRR